MTEKELISKLKELKQIKPKESWVFSLKTNIFESNPVHSNGFKKAEYAQITPNIISLVYGKRKLAYSFAVLLFIFTGLYSFMNFYSLQQAKIANENLLMVQAELTSNVKIFKEKSVNLAEVVKMDQMEKIDLAIEEAKIATENLTDSIKKEPSLAKTIASEISNNKTYLNVAGSEYLQETSNDLYKTIDEQLINDLKKATLTYDQQKSLEEIVYLYDKKEYADALESILMLNITLNASEQQPESLQPEIIEESTGQINEQLGE